MSIMSIFRSFKLSWWQAGLYKISLISLGIVLGVTFYDTLILQVQTFFFIFLIFAIYLTTVWWRQEE